MQTNASNGATMQLKAIISTAWTATVSFLGGWLYAANAWFAEYMPLVTGVGILASAGLTAWYYRNLIQIKRAEAGLVEKRQE